MKSLSKAMLILILSIACTQIMSASTVTKNYTVKEFSKLKVSSAFQVEFIHSNENKVSVEIDEDVAQYVYVSNEGSELIIKLKENTSSNTHTMKAKVYGNSLSAIVISGASEFTSDYTFAENDMHITGSGASKIDISINAKNADINISGASKTTVKGSATKQTIVASGASHYYGKDCKSTNANITASGASKVTVDCSDVLDAAASGASSVTYVNSPKTVNKSTSGASDIKQD